MIVLRCSSSFSSVEELVEASKKIGGLLIISPQAAKTKMELVAAFELARKAFKEKRNISDKIQNEALLFLAKETNFSSAIKKVGAKSASDFLIASERKLSRAVKKRLRLERAEACRIPLWGKKIGNYYEAELEIEKMALCRIE
ncbi:MAG: hypothetical protein N3G80_00385 [Candidatus Micrarchaeota archaeon]|nr:hypothetical protein [Candidatus Micrarchaeota archaeon]